MSDASVIEQELIANYIGTAASALYLFESCITVPQEFRVIWSRKWTVMTWLYASTRYITFWVQIVSLLSGTTHLSCVVGAIVFEVLTIAQYLCFAVFAAMRVYVLLSGKLVIPGVVFALNLIPFATNTFISVKSRTTWLADAQSCDAVVAVSENTILRLSLTTRIGLIVSELIVLWVTWSKTIDAYRHARQSNLQAPLVTFLFRDGALYFLLLIIINVLEVVSDVIPQLLGLDFADPFLQSLVPITICRFILNLRQAGSSMTLGSSSSHSVNTRYVGNMGESLRFGREDSMEDSEECWLDSCSTPRIREEDHAVHHELEVP